MAALHKEVWNRDGQDIKAVIAYDKDGMPKRYRVTVVPVQITKLENGMQMESYGAYTGFNDTLVAPVERQSKKRLEEAIKILQERKEVYIDHIMKMKNQK